MRGEVGTISADGPTESHVCLGARIRTHLLGGTLLSKEDFAAFFGVPFVSRR